MEVKTKIHFITYGNSVFEKAKERIVKEAKNFYRKLQNKMDY